MRLPPATIRTPESAARAPTLDPASVVAARNALLAACGLAVIGAAFGLVFAAPMGAIHGFGVWLVVACLIFASGALLLLLIWPLDRVAPIAISATLFFAAYQSALAIFAVFDPTSRESLFVALIWFTPLMAFNKIVNRGRVAEALTWVLIATPLLLTALLWPWSARLFPPALRVILIVLCLAHVMTAVMLGVLWRYREAFIGEKERSASSRFAAEILESISESFVLVDRALRVLYLNRSAGAVLGVPPARALGARLDEGETPLASPTIVRALTAAWAGTGPRRFEAETGGAIYDVRCTPGDAEMSIYFQDITDHRAAREALQASARRQAEQAEVLDKANDLIVVRDIPGRVIYWNQSAARLSGIPADDAVGRPAHELFGVDPADIKAATEKVLADGDWRRVISVVGAGGQAYVLDSHLSVDRRGRRTPLAG